MKVIYEPRGRAREYAGLACNLYTGCTHGCKYCFAPACMRKNPEEWRVNARPRENVVRDFELDAKEARRRCAQTPILLCFTCDPYQPLEESEGVTRRVLEIASRESLDVTVLTKGRAGLVGRDLELMSRSGFGLGVSLSFSDDASRREWEPGASSVDERLALLREAWKMDIYTWVSLEPVIDPGQALEVIRKAAPYVDFWKVGKLNHMREAEDRVDWARFLADATALLDKLKAKYYVKQDLRTAGKNENNQGLR